VRRSRALFFEMRERGASGEWGVHSAECRKDNTVRASGLFCAFSRPLPCPKSPSVSASIAQVSASIGQYRLVSPPKNKKLGRVIARISRISTKPEEIQPKEDTCRERTQRTHRLEVILSASFVIFVIFCGQIVSEDTGIKAQHPLSLYLWPLSRVLATSLFVL
jgi:hypothetical protein